MTDKYKEEVDKYLIDTSKYDNDDEQESDEKSYSQEKRITFEKERYEKKRAFRRVIGYVKEQN